MRKLLRHPWLIISIVLAITVFFSIQLPKTKIDNDVTHFIPEKDPAKLAYENAEDIFGSQSFVSVALKAKRGTILSKETLSYIQEITKKFTNLDYVQDVDSLTNVDFIAGTAEGMEVSPLVGNFNGTEEELQKIKTKLLSWDAYRRNLFSDDFKATQILIRLEKDLPIETWEKSYYDIKAILKECPQKGLKSYMAGNPVISVLMGKNMRRDLRHLIPFVIILVLMVLFLSFRNIGGVVLPMITVLISSIWTIGLIALLNIPLSMIATIIPVLLIAVGSAYGIHIISHYYDQLRAKRGALSAEVQREIVFETLHRVGRPVLLAGLTTIAGFGALSTSAILPMKHFGIFTAVGVLVALIVALTFIPSLLLLRKNKLPSSSIKNTGENTGKESRRMLNSLLSAYHRVITQRKAGIILLIIIIIPVSLYGMSKIIIDNPLVEYFKSDTEIHAADNFLRENFGGTKSFSIIVKGKEKGDLTDPEILKAMDDLSVYLRETYEEVGKVTSFSDFIKRMNMVMNFTDEEEITEGEAPPESETGFEGSFLSDDSDYTGGNFESFFTEDIMEKNTGENEDLSQMPESTVKNKTIDAALSTRDFLQLINKVYAKAENTSITAEEFLQIINREFNYNGEAYNEIPYDPAKYPVADRAELKNLISQYLLLYSGNLDDFADDDLEPTQARIMVQMRTTGNRFTKKIDRDIMQYVEDYFPEGYTVEIAGIANIESSLTDFIIKAQMKSIIISLSLVFIIVSVSFRSAAAGIFGIIPLSLSLLINFAVMGFMGIRLDITTAMVASITIGIGIDYAIHFLSGYHIERKKTNDLEKVTKNTLMTSGKAIIFNALSVAAGFAVLILSQFNPLMYGGFLISFTMITSSLAAMTILPVLLNIFKPKFIRK